MWPHVISWNVNKSTPSEREREHAHFFTVIGTDGTRFKAWVNPLTPQSTRKEQRAAMRQLRKQGAPFATADAIVRRMTGREHHTEITMADGGGVQASKLIEEMNASQSKRRRRY